MEYTIKLTVDCVDGVERKYINVSKTAESPYIKDNAPNTIYMIHKALISFAAQYPDTIINSVSVNSLTAEKR